MHNIPFEVVAIESVVAVVVVATVVAIVVAVYTFCIYIVIELGVHYHLK